MGIAGRCWARMWTWLTSAEGVRPLRRAERRGAISETYQINAGEESVNSGRYMQGWRGKKGRRGVVEKLEIRRAVAWRRKQKRKQKRGCGGIA